MFSIQRNTAAVSHKKFKKIEKLKKAREFLRDAISGLSFDKRESNDFGAKMVTDHRTYLMSEFCPYLWTLERTSEQTGENRRGKEKLSELKVK